MAFPGGESGVSLLPPRSFVFKPAHHLCRCSFGPIISHLLSVWRSVEKLCGYSHVWNSKTPLFNNPNLLIGDQPIQFSEWRERGISVLGDIYADEGLYSFQILCSKFNLPRSSFFFYLQLRLALKAGGVPWQSPLPSHPLHKIVHCTRGTSGLVSRLYRFISQHAHRPLALDTLWRADFPDLDPTFDWHKVWSNILIASRNPGHQEIHYNFIHRVHLTPRKLCIMKVTTESACTLCPIKATGTYLHMFWECPTVARFWRMIASNLSMLFENTVPYSPFIFLLNDLSSLNLTLPQKLAFLAGLTAAKKLVATRWKLPHTLSSRAWILTYLDIAYLELSTAHMHGAKESMAELWSSISEKLKTLL